MTNDQDIKIKSLKREGYIWNKEKSMSAAGVIMEKGKDFYFFGVSGEIMHNPTGLIIRS